MYLYIFIFVVVFFFKQKTAYEMRISDWSSDVCSSDLDQLGDRLGVVAHVLLVEQDVVLEVGLDLALDDLGDDVLGLAGLLGLLVGDQIGRASCRERVCQYV